LSSPKRGHPRLLKSKRVYAYGYRENERCSIPPLVGKQFEAKGSKINLDTTFKLHKVYENADKSRPVVQASLGPHVEGLCMPHPDPSDATTALTGAMYRFCREIPAKNFPKREFTEFVKFWLEDNMIPIEPFADTSVRAWLDKTPYTLKRKHELMTKFDQLNCAAYQLDDRYLQVKSFIKDEVYPEYKHARAINSRTDEFKCAVGPICQLISDKMFSLPWFIKKIPIANRPKYILDRLQRAGSTYFTSDYTSFEAHFKAEMMDACEHQLFEYMTTSLPDGDKFVELMRRAKSDHPNLISFKRGTLEIKAKRMSGEMDTSLSNGFSNLMFMLFLCSKNGNTNVSGVIEGDDGLFVMDGDAPPAAMFEDFGLTIKIQIFEDLAHASFCGMVFDLDDQKNVTNPIEELINFGWTTARYAKSRTSVHKCLIRAKALSLAYQYPACPVLSKFAYQMCKLTAGYDSMSWVNSQSGHAFNLYEIEMIRKSHEYFSSKNLLEEPGIGTRLLVEQLYGLTVAEQVILEKYIETLTSLDALSHPIIYQHAKPEWSDYYDSYALRMAVNDDHASFAVKWPEARPKADLTAFMKKK